MSVNTQVRQCPAQWELVIEIYRTAVPRVEIQHLGRPSRQQAQDAFDMLRSYLPATGDRIRAAHIDPPVNSGQARIDLR